LYVPPLCEATTGYCVNCTSNAQCNTSQAPVCVLGSLDAGVQTGGGTCGCQTNADCGADRVCLVGVGAAGFCTAACVYDGGLDSCYVFDQLCNTLTGMCLGCLDNYDCQGAGPIGIPTPFCKQDAGYCVACLTKSDCGDAGFCVQNNCVQCATDQDCDGQPGTPFCVDDTCEQCRTSTDCPPGESCVFGACY
jgi:hypothetical protein